MCVLKETGSGWSVGRFPVVIGGGKESYAGFQILNGFAKDKNCLCVVCVYPCPGVGRLTKLGYSARLFNCRYITLQCDPTKIPASPGHIYIPSKKVNSKY